MDYRRRVILLAVTMAAGIAVGMLPRMPQPIDHHNFVNVQPFA